MSESTVAHRTFSIERPYPVPPARVFAAFADEATKRRWFAHDVGSEVHEFSLDFRVGGREISRFRFTGGGAPGAPPPGTQISNDTTYLDIVANERIVFAYTMTVADRRMSASLATIELFPADGGTRLVFTEQGAFFSPADGPQLREAGWRELLAKLADAVAKSR